MKGTKIKGDAIHFKAFAMVSSVALEDRRLSYRDKIVYSTIINIARGKNHVCYASADTLAERSSMGRTSVFQALSHLETLGYISRKSRLGTTDIIYFSSLPVYDFPPELYGGEMAAHWQTVDKLCAKLVEMRESDYVQYDYRTGRVQFLNGTEPTPVHDIEILIKIIEGYKTALPDMPTGLEKKSARVDCLDVISNCGINETVLPSIVEFVNNSEFVRGKNKRHEKKTLRWILDNLDDCLDEDSRYLDYDKTKENAIHDAYRREMA